MSNEATYIPPEMVTAEGPVDAYLERRLTQSILYSKLERASGVNWPISSGDYSTSFTSDSTSHSLHKHIVAIHGLESENVVRTSETQLLGIDQTFDHIVKAAVQTGSREHPALFVDNGGAYRLSWCRLAYENRVAVANGLAIFVVTNIEKRPLAFSDFMAGSGAENYTDPQELKALYDLGTPYITQVSARPSEFSGVKMKSSIGVEVNLRDIALLHERISTARYSLLSDVEMQTLGNSLSSQGVYIIEGLSSDAKDSLLPNVPSQVSPKRAAFGINQLLENGGFEQVKTIDEGPNKDRTIFSGTTIVRRTGGYKIFG